MRDTHGRFESNYIDNYELPDEPLGPTRTLYRAKADLLSKEIHIVEYPDMTPVKTTIVYVKSYVYDEKVSSESYTISGPKGRFSLGNTEEKALQSLKDYENPTAEVVTWTAYDGTCKQLIESEGWNKDLMIARIREKLGAKKNKSHSNTETVNENEIIMQL